MVAHHIRRVRLLFGINPVGNNVFLLVEYIVLRYIHSVIGEIGRYGIVF